MMSLQGSTLPLKSDIEKLCQVTFINYINFGAQLT